MSKFSGRYFQIKRSFDNSAFVYRIYTIWILIAFAGLGFFAIKPTLQVIQQKKQLITELEGINTRLQTNISELDNLRNGILSDTQVLTILDSSMPPTMDVQGYIVQLSDAVSSAGFVLKRVSAPGWSTDPLSGQTIQINLSGPGNFPMLLKNIEKLKRISKIGTYNYILDTHSSVPGDANVTLSLTIYSMGVSQ